MANMVRGPSEFNDVAPHILLHTKGNGNFSWTDGYAGVTNEELEVLLLQSRHSSTSLEAELEHRRLRKASNKPDGIDGCLDRLHKLADQIKIRGRLDDRATKHAKTAVEVLERVQTTRSLKVYQEFLHDVLRQCGPELVLLCAVSLGKHKVANLKTEDRVRLLDCVNKDKLALNVHGLSVLAENYQIPTLNSPRLAHLADLPQKTVLDDKYPSSAPPLPLPLDEVGARVILAAVTKDRNALSITLPVPHEMLPYMIIPHQICADIMRKYTS